METRLTSKFVNDRLSRLRDKRICDRLSRLTGKSINDRLSRLTGKTINDRLSRLKGKSVNDRLSRLTGKPVNDSLSLHTLHVLRESSVYNGYHQWRYESSGEYSSLSVVSLSCNAQNMFIQTSENAWLAVCLSTQAPSWWKHIRELKFLRRKGSASPTRSDTFCMEYVQSKLSL